MIIFMEVHEQMIGGLQNRFFAFFREWKQVGGPMLHA